MAEQKRRLVMDVVAPPPVPEPPAKKQKFDWSKVKRLRKIIPARKVVLATCAFVTVLVIAAGAIFFVHRSSGPLPTDVVKNAGFPLYYPTPLPDGYSYQSNSAKFLNSYVFYTLQNGSRSISVSEQPAPFIPPDLAHLAGFTSLKTLAGDAVSGNNFSGQPSAIIVSNTTMITITGQRGLPSDIISQLAQNMRSLPQQ